jgi:hypothetical protein
VSYTVEKNTLKIKAGERVKNDTDSIYIGSINGCSTLTINVSQISGQYPWGDKVIGFSFANDAIQPHQWGNQASFPPPRGRGIEDGFIKAGLTNNTKLVYDIDNITKTTHIGAKVFIGSNNSLELQFSAQPASQELQFSAQPASRESRFSGQQASRSSKPGTAQTRYQSDGSCSMNCHGPHDAGSSFVFTRDFSISSHAACRYRGD